jgi:hypothetical protein
MPTASAARERPATADAPVLDDIEAAVYVIPTDAPEADGTLAWSETTMVLVTARAGGEQGIGWTYAAAAAATVVADVLAGTVLGRSAFDVTGATEAMARAVRNIGRPGVAAMAISAVDVALWDLKARLLGLHAHVGAATANLRHVEYFHDHQRIEQLLFDGALDAHGGVLTPDPGRPRRAAAGGGRRAIPAIMRHAAGMPIAERGLPARNLIGGMTDENCQQPDLTGYRRDPHLRRDGAPPIPEPAGHRRGLDGGRRGRVLHSPPGIWVAAPPDGRAEKQPQALGEPGRGDPLPALHHAQPRRFRR